MKKWSIETSSDYAVAVIKCELPMSLEELKALAIDLEFTIHEMEEAESEFIDKHRD